MAESIRDKVAIVGVGACQFGENWDQSREDMIVDAAYEAYADAGIDDPQRRIEAVFAGAVYPREGTSEIAEALKLRNRISVARAGRPEKATAPASRAADIAFI